MKLKELLKVIPDDCEIGLIPWDNGFSVSFGNLWEAIGELYYTFVAFHIPTKYLSIDITDTLVKITLSYKGLKVLFPVYGEEE